MKRIMGQSRPEPDDEVIAGVESAVLAVLGPGAGVVLAVSGGRDSMVLLDTATRVARDRVRLVATFDHSTGPHSSASVELVRRTAAEHGIAIAVGVAPTVGRSEAEWRAGRWAFLHAAASSAGGIPVATAHTEDDQVETVFMRTLRGAGARGLAGLYAPGTVLRPLLDVPRVAVATYAAARRVDFVEDPSNDERHFLRSRVRHDLLPAIARAHPEFRGELLALARRAGGWRAEVEALVATWATAADGGCALGVPLSVLADLTADDLAIVWPALAARMGVTLDWRGTRRLAGFTRTSRSGDLMPLSGGATVCRARERFVLRRPAVDISPARCSVADGGVQAVGEGVGCGPFHFRAVPRSAAAEESVGGALWAAEFDAAAHLTVRPWVAGDRMQLVAGGQARRVKRFLADAHVPAGERPRWPVVLADGAIAWIPGVRRSDAATVRPGRPGVRYECDRNDG